jgi:hypothetical protein
VAGSCECGNEPSGSIKRGGICHTGFEQDQDETEFYPDPPRKLSTNLYNRHHCCVYDEKLLMMDKETARNM